MSQFSKSPNTKNNIVDMCAKKIPFTSSEKELIVALVRERPIIEDKRTNSKNIELKKQAWEDLTAAFNSQPYISQRNNTQLKRCWENMKTQRKKELSQEAISIRRTGGGPPDAGPSSSDNIIDIICPAINLIVPDVIDSNSIEILSDLEKKNYLPSGQTEVEKESGYDTMTANVSFTGETDENIPPASKRKLKYMDTPTSSKKIIKENIFSPSIYDEEKSNGDETKHIIPQQKRIIPTSAKNLTSETQARIRRTHINSDHDQALFEVRMAREQIILQREKNLLKHEKIMHKLQIEKLEIEISNLKQKLQ